jgi:hypothetical protein
MATRWEESLVEPITSILIASDTGCNAKEKCLPWAERVTGATASLSHSSQLWTAMILAAHPPPLWPRSREAIRVANLGSPEPGA